MANRQGPAAVYKYWAWFGSERLLLAPGVWGRSELLGRCWHLASPRRFVKEGTVARDFLLLVVLARGFFPLEVAAREFSKRAVFARDFHLLTVLARGFFPLEVAAREFSLPAVPARDFLFPTVSSCGSFSHGGAASVFSLTAVFARYFFLPTVVAPGLFLLAFAVRGFSKPYSGCACFRVVLGSVARSMSLRSLTGVIFSLFLVLSRLSVARFSLIDPHLLSGLWLQTCRGCFLCVSHSCVRSGWRSHLLCSPGWLHPHGPTPIPGSELLVSVFVCGAGGSP